MKDATWKTGRFTLFDVHDRPIAEVTRVKAGWSYWVAGTDIGGDVSTAVEAMGEVEKALGIKTTATQPA